MAFYEFLDSRSNPENKYKLHEAMEIVLNERLNKMASINLFSEEIRKMDFYRQKAGGPAPPSQIPLRARNYAQFEIVGDKVKLVR
jgi:hypothetical protein